MAGNRQEINYVEVTQNYVEVRQVLVVISAILFVISLIMVGIAVSSASTLSAAKALRPECFAPEGSDE